MNATIIINVITSAVVFVIGLLIAVGIVTPTFDASLRITFGVLFMAYGVYRFVTAQTKMKQMKINEQRERLRVEKEKLLKDANNL
ncbi:MAG TPA: hypothetical protein PLG90_06785 [Ignavibacteria bacterium]|nr:hypothetical protein [Ignavibacteria bacterium]